MNSSMNARPKRTVIAPYQGPATNTQSKPIQNKSDRKRFDRYNHHNDGIHSANATNPLAITANPRNAPATQAGPPNTATSSETVRLAVNRTSVTPTLPNANHPAVPANRIDECSAIPHPNRGFKYLNNQTHNPTATSATGNRGAFSGPNPNSEPMPVIQYNNAGFSNHGEPHNLGVIQSPDRAISTPIAAYRGSSGPKMPTRESPVKYTRAMPANRQSRKMEGRESKHNQSNNAGDVY